MELLRELGTVVWLDGDVRELHARASRIGNRPMLEGRSMAEIEELYRARQPYYRRAHIVIDTTGVGADQVVGRILSALRQAPAIRSLAPTHRQAAVFVRRDGHLAARRQFLR